MNGFHIIVLCRLLLLSTVRLPMQYTVRFTETGRERVLLPSLSERTAVAFARSESGVYRTGVSLWLGSELVAAFEAGDAVTVK
jgi:hypothetical protein